MKELALNYDLLGRDSKQLANGFVCVANRPLLLQQNYAPLIPKALFPGLEQLVVVSQPEDEQPFSVQTEDGVSFFNAQYAAFILSKLVIVTISSSMIRFWAHRSHPDLKLCDDSSSHHHPTLPAVA